MGRDRFFLYIFDIRLDLINYVTCFQFPDEPTRQQRRDAKELVSARDNPINFLYNLNTWDLGNQNVVVKRFEDFLQL
jgi:hypothetical protein